MKNSTIVRVRSGGPRTAEGKARSRRNALKHGLAACYKQNPLLLQQTKKLARALCKDYEDELLYEQALVVAEYDQVLRRVQALKIAMIERLRDPFATPISKGNAKLATYKRVAKQRNYAIAAYWQFRTKLTGEKLDRPTIKTYRSFGIDLRQVGPNGAQEYEPLKDRDEYEAMRQAIRDLERIRRYERRAWSRRNGAIRGFIAIQATAVTSKDAGQLEPAAT